MKKHEWFEHPKLRKFIKHIEKDEYLFRQGQPGHTMFIVLEGVVELIAERETGTHITGLLGTGEFLGEKALVYKDPYQRYYSAKAAENTTVLEVSHQDLDFLRIAVPDLMTDLMIQVFSIAARRLANMNVLIHSLRSSNNDERFLRCVMYFCRTVGMATEEGTQVALSPEGIHYYIDLPLDQIRARMEDLQKQGLIRKQDSEFFLVPSVQALAERLPRTSSPSV